MTLGPIRPYDVGRDGHLTLFCVHKLPKLDHISTSHHLLASYHHNYYANIRCHLLLIWNVVPSLLVLYWKYKYRYPLVNLLCKILAQFTVMSYVTSQTIISYNIARLRGIYQITLPWPRSKPTCWVWTMP